MDRKTTIEQEGQSYIDEAIYIQPSQISIIGKSIARAFNQAQPEPILVRYERVRLCWMKPDGKGGLMLK